MKHVSERELWESTEYYMENSFGYDSIEEYVRMDYCFVKDEDEIQRIIDLKDGTAVKITISSYYSPKGNAIHEVGIEPDILCELDVEQYLADETDNQLERAKDVVLQKMND